MKKRVADVIFDTLAEVGIDTCFCVVGGGAMHLNNALLHASKITTIFNHHEQACSIAAEGYARLSGKIAAVCVTSGPGGINAINGVQGAWVDSIPMIVISGFPRWKTSALASNLDIRTAGVQENDIISMVSGITKYTKNLISPKEVRAEVKYAVSCAMSGRRGPVWLNVPLDVQAELVDEDELLDRFSFSDKSTNSFDEKIEQLSLYIEESKRPCILSGSGIRSSNCRKEFHDFATRMNIPVVGGYLQSDICHKSFPRYYGLSGSSGSRCGNFILQNADLIIVLGNSLSTGQTGFNRDAFACNSKMVMVDAQKDEALKPGLNIDLVIESDLRDFFMKASCLKIWSENTEWVNYCEKLYRKFTATELLDGVINTFSGSEPIPQLMFWNKIYDHVEDDAVFVLGSNSAIMGALENSVKSIDQRIVCNYNSGSMGYDLPAAIGAFAYSGHDIYCITGDGSIMMNLQELQTIKYNKMPIKIIIFSNNGYNAIRNTCDRYFNGEHVGCDESTGLSLPNFMKIAEAFDFPYYRCERISELDEALGWITKINTGGILEILEMQNEIGSPAVASTMDSQGRFKTPPLHIMTPLLNDAELESYML